VEVNVLDCPSSKTTLPQTLWTDTHISCLQSATSRLCLVGFSPIPTLQRRAIMLSDVKLSFTQVEAQSITELRLCRKKSYRSGNWKFPCHG